MGQHLEAEVIDTARESQCIKLPMHLHATRPGLLRSCNH